jgi:hypothetical protein
VTDYDLRIGTLPVGCDFCEHGHPRYEYPCGDFTYEQPPVSGPRGTAAGNARYFGPWLACLRCHELLEAGDLDVLFERCWSFIVLNRGPMARTGYDQVRANVVSLWQRFMEHRQGPPRLVRLEGRPNRGIAGEVHLIDPGEAT